MADNKEEIIEETESVSKEDFDAKEKECEELRDRYMRTMAEYDNFRKRSARERETLYSDAECSAISEFLAVYDNLERALGVETADEAYKKGVEMIFTGFNEALTKLKVDVQTEWVSEEHYRLTLSSGSPS